MKYRIEVHETTIRVLERHIDADSEQQARELAELETWEHWPEVIASTEMRIAKVEPIDEEYNFYDRR